eukprot:scaffold3283_cov237-Pinguiococcus_pyrenoidosus.AAC.1
MYCARDGTEAEGWHRSRGRSSTAVGQLLPTSPKTTTARKEDGFSAPSEQSFHAAHEQRRSVACVTRRSHKQRCTAQEMHKEPAKTQRTCENTKNLRKHKEPAKTQRTCENTKNLRKHENANAPPYRRTTTPPYDNTTTPPHQKNQKKQLVCILTIRLILCLKSQQAMWTQTTRSFQTTASSELATLQVATGYSHLPRGKGVPVYSFFKSVILLLVYSARALKRYGPLP